MLRENLGSKNDNPSDISGGYPDKPQQKILKSLKVG